MYKLRRKRRNRNNRRGASAVEFAMVSPAFLIVIFCCVEFGRISMMRNLAQNAAYEAARSVITEGAVNQDAIDQAELVLSRLAANGATIDVNGGQAIDFDTPEVTVRIELPMRENSLVLPHLYGDRTIIAEVTLNTERYRGFFDGGIGNDTAN